MRGASSGPTNRALDVLQLLARDPPHGMRYIDIVRSLDLNQGTAHTMLKTLVDRGWVSRDPTDKTFTLGPALAAVAVYGAAFAVFAAPAERKAWLSRTATQSKAVSDALDRALELTRERGYDVDWTTPTVAQMSTCS